MQLLFIYLNVWFVLFRYIIFTNNASGSNLLDVKNNMPIDIVLLINIFKK